MGRKPSEKTVSKTPYDPHLEAVFVKVLADGSVVYRIRKRDSDGKEHSKVLHPEPGMTNGEIFDWLVGERKEFLKDLNSVCGPITSRSTLSEYFDAVFVKKKELTVRPKTIFDYKARFEKHARNDIGTKKIGEISKLDLMQYYNRLADNGVGEGIIQTMHRLIKAILSSAMDDDVIYKNVAKGAGVAPMKKVPKGRTLNEEEVLRLQECIEKENPMWRTLFNVMLHTGCRRGEIAGLRWEDVDLVEGTIHVCHSLVYTPGIGLVLGDAKSEMSNRDIPLMHDDRVALYNMREQCDRGYVFNCNSDPERPIFPDTISSHLSDLCDRNGLPHFSPHMLRRTLPTLLITRYNVDPKTLQCILGHSNISTTLGYYTMVDGDQSRRTMEMYGDIIRKPVENINRKTEKRTAKRKQDDIRNLGYIQGSENLKIVIGKNN